MAALKDPDPFVRRAAAEVLGAHPRPANVAPLLALRQTTSDEDTHLIHVARMALRDQLKTGGAWASLKTLRLSDRDRRDLADVALGVPSAAAAAFLMEERNTVQESQENLMRHVHHVARYGAAGTSARLSRMTDENDRSPAVRLAILRAIQQGTLERGAVLEGGLRARGVDLCRKLLAAGSDSDVGLAIESARELGLTELIPDLEALTNRKELPESIRGEVQRAIAAIDPARAVTLLRQVLGNASLGLELREPEGAVAILKAIEAGKASARLLQERRVVIGMENAEIPRLTERLAAALKGLPPADQKLKELMRDRRDSFLKTAHDPARGARLFEKNCAICHQLEGKGAKVGPQLEGIGSRGLDRLLEDVLDPNRNVDQSFRVTNLGLQDGQLVSGLLLREEGEILVVADAQGKEVRVPRSSVEERSTAQLSPMPANMAEQLSEAEFADLMSYLLEHKEEKGPK
jgi:putative heme-binding domain-containing protein